jgi:uncharacterized protein YceK
MKRQGLIPFILIAAVSLAGCASTGSEDSSTAGGDPGAGGGSAPAASASQQYCITKSCIIHDLDQSLVGAVAKDESVAVKAVCKESTVKGYPDQVWSAKCTVTYSDGNTATGTGNMLLSQNKVTFTPAGV